MELPLYSDSDCNGDLTCKLINLHTCGGKLQSEDHLEDWSLGLSYWMLLKETLIHQILIKCRECLINNMGKL